jgi:hypothetical protein
MSLLTLDFQGHSGKEKTNLEKFSFRLLTNDIISHINNKT